MNKSENFDWNLLRKHTLLIEKYCKKHMNDKIPGINQGSIEESYPRLQRKCLRLSN